MSKEYIISFYRVILFTLFALLSTFNAGAQKEYSVYFYDSLRSRVIPVTVYSPSKVNKKTQVVIFNHGYDGNQNPKSNQTYSYLTRLGCICDETLHQLFCDWMVQWSKEPPPMEMLTMTILQLYLTKIIAVILNINVKEAIG